MLGQTDRQTDGQVEGHCTVVQTVLRVLLAHSLFSRDCNCTAPTPLFVLAYYLTVFCAQAYVVSGFVSL